MDLNGLIPQKSEYCSFGSIFFVGQIHVVVSTRGSPWQLNNFVVITLYQQQHVGFTYLIIIHDNGINNPAID